MRALFGIPALFIQTLVVVFMVPTLVGVMLVAMQVHQFKEQYATHATHSATLIAQSITRVPPTQRAPWFTQLLSRADSKIPILGIRLSDSNDRVTVMVGKTTDMMGDTYDVTNRAGDQLRIAVRRPETAVLWITGIGVTLLFSLAASVAFYIAIWPTVSSMGRSLDEVLRALHTYRQSNFHARVRETGSGRFLLLEQAINRTGKTLQAAQERTLEVVGHTTDELQSTLEEVEIKNVELDLARQRAVKDAQDKSRFLANMSHEIRTPMNSIVGYTQLLNNTALSDSQLGYAQSIGQSARALLEIIEDILSLSRLEAGKLALATQEFDIRVIAERSLNMLAPAAYQKALTMRALIDPDVPVCFLGDPLRIRQILVNFLTNAIKFTERGSVELIVSATRQTERNAMLSLTVRDTGRGIARHDRSRLFDAFTDTSRKEAGGGTGLGLTIARALTSAMGGQLSLESELNAGSSFSVQLPLKTNYDRRYSFLEELAARKVIVAVRDAVLRDHLGEHLTANDIDVTYVGDWRDVLNQDDGLSDADFVVLDVAASDADPLIKRWPGGRPTPIVLLSSEDNSQFFRIAESLQGHVLPAYVSATRVIAQMADHLGINVADFEPDTRGPTFPDVAGAKVLIAEDDRLGRAYLEELLSQHGVQVTACADGQQAVTLARDVQFDAIFLDARMPVCDGEQAARQIRARSRNRLTALYALTASAMDEDRERFAAAGIDECLIKPASPSELLSRIAGGVEARAPRPKSPTVDSQMQGMLLEELAKYRQQLTDAQALKDSAKLFDVAHRLHGAASVCRIESLRTAAAALEAAARSKDLHAMETERDAVLVLINERLDAPVDASSAAG
ncbi:MAG: ATP-binding protein [Gammaproteobacteria bacterium]